MAEKVAEDVVNQQTMLHRKLQRTSEMQTRRVCGENCVGLEWKEALIGVN